LLDTAMTEADFVRAVTAEPDDDTVRLAFADWLDEQGKLGRAQFIRVQIERARLDEFDPRQSALMATELRLIAEHAADVIGEFYALPDFRLRRGFVEMIQGPAHFFARGLEYCCGLAPIREIRLTGMTESGMGAKLGAVNSAGTNRETGDQRPEGRAARNGGGARAAEVTKLEEGAQLDARHGHRSGRTPRRTRPPRLRRLARDSPQQPGSRQPRERDC
jgi:uncharacterized protein (TIGR02996 family)